MKENKNLDELLNKMVEFNQPGVSNYKGFLYKNSKNYYIKVVDSIIGSQLINQIVILNDDDNKYIKHSLKPKLMIVSKNSWHYRLMKYVLKNNTPTPKTMQNGCPYFWLLMFSLLVIPFLFIFKSIIWLILLIPKYYFKLIDYLASIWIDSLSDVDSYEYYENYEKNKIPLHIKMYLNKLSKDNYQSSYSQFIEYFINKKYNLYKNDFLFQKKKDEMQNKWIDWVREKYIADNEKHKLDCEKEDLIYLKKQEKRKKYLKEKALRDAKWEKIMQPINNGFNNLFKSIGLVFSKIRNQFKTNPANWKNIIRRTKQIVGGIITLFFLLITYVVVNGLVLLFTIVLDFLIDKWVYVAGVGVTGILIGLLYLIITLLTGWVQNIINKYKKGKKIWYFEPIRFFIIYILFYPVKYIILGIGYLLLFIIWKPIELIFYKILWNIIIFPIVKWVIKNIANGYIWLYNNLVSSTGIFGQYLGSSYTDYCPGLEFQDFDEEELN